jgi:hypothetical protein
MPVTPRTALFANKQSGGMHAVEDMTLSTGSRFFVHGTDGTDGAGYGRNPDAPVATIDYAVGLCTANKGDIIFAMPGHTETVSAAADIALDVAGITVWGLGNGTNRPTVTLDTANTADIDVDAANITVRNIIFSANFADIAAAIDVNADDFTLDGCHFQATATNMNAKIWVQDAAATASDRITIKNCTANVVDAANTHFVNFAGTGDGHIIMDNILHGDWGTMCIGGAGVVTRVTILRNLINNVASDNDACINLAATATGIIAHNMVGSASAADKITAADCCAFENYGAIIDEDLSGVLQPIAT